MKPITTLVNQEREVSPSYVVPVGVAHHRENVHVIATTAAAHVLAAVATCEERDFSFSHDAIVTVTVVPALNLALNLDLALALYP